MPEEARFARIEARVKSLEARQEEHRAILMGDGLEGRGGIRGDVSRLKDDMKDRFTRQNTILYGLAGMAAIAVPSHIKDVIAIIAKLFAGS